MAQSLAAVYVYLIFSTKERCPFLQEENLRRELHEYLGGASKTLESPAIRVGGTEDHVHMLAQMARTIAISNWVKEVKRVSSIWLKAHDPRLTRFRWQAGYGVFSVSHSNLGQVVKYIERQEEHHRRFGFQEELRAFFRKHKVEYDERYVWD